MKVRKVRVWMALLICIILSGCNAAENKVEITNKQNVEVQKVNDQFAEAFSYAGVINGFPIIENLSGKDMEIDRFNPKTDTIEKICLIDDFSMSMRFSVEDGPYYYVFMSTNINDGKPTLFRINVETLEKEIISHPLDTVPGFSLHKCGNKLITFGKSVTNDTTYQFVETYDLDSEEWESIREFSYDMNSSEGTVPLGMCADDSNIYILCENRDSLNGKRAVLLVINNKGEIQGTIKVSEEIHNYVATSFIADMQIFGEYIYILNASNYCFIGKLEKKEMKEIYRNRDFEVAYGYRGNNPLFFERNSRNLYELTEEGLRLFEISVNDDSKQILLCLADDKDCYVVCINTVDASKTAYVFERNKMGNIYIP